MKKTPRIIVGLLIAVAIAVSPAWAAKKKAATKPAAKADTRKAEQCCPNFNPKTWDGKTVTWKNKRFIRDRIRSAFHIPLNFGSVVTRMIERTRAANAGVKAKDYVLLADENSLWGADLYLAISKDVPAADNVKISGKFLCKVFEGPFKNMKQWVKEMDEFVKEKKKETKKMYFFYTTCPKCAKATGKNYVVILAEI
jgi:hypothetical protein